MLNPELVKIYGEESRDMLNKLAIFRISLHLFI